MELPDCRVSFLGISALNSCEQYAKAGSALPNHVMKKKKTTLTTVLWELLIVSFLLQTDPRFVCLSHIFLPGNIFESAQDETMPRESPGSWPPCQTSGGYSNIGHKSKYKKSNTRVWENLLNILQRRTHCHLRLDFRTTRRLKQWLNFLLWLFLWH